MRDYEHIEYAVDLVEPLRSDGHKIIGTVRIRNLSETKPIVFDEPGTLGINIGWRLWGDGETLCEGRLNPSGGLAPLEERDFALSSDLPFSFDGSYLVTVDLVIETVAWLGTDHPDRAAKAHLDLRPNARFDPKWYCQSLGITRPMTAEEARAHYERYQKGFGSTPSPYLAPNFIRQQAEKLNLDTACPTTLFETHSAQIDPHPILRRTPETYGTVKCPTPLPEGEYDNQSWFILRHLDKPGIRISPFLDPDFIRLENGRQAPRPIRYALRHLYHTDQKLSALFDPAFYLASNPDVRALVNEQRSFKSALQHFLEVGIRENRAPIPDFDVDYYRDHNRDVFEAEQKGGLSLTEHFYYFGIAEGRNPNEYFDTHYYVTQQPDVPEECRRLGLAGPFEHFLKFGYAKGYKAARPLEDRALPDWMGKAAYEKRCRVTTTTLMRDGRKITFPKPGQDPALTCVIPICNQFEMTVHLLQALSDFAWRGDTPETEVLLVDNGSTDQTVDLADLVENAPIYRTPNPVGYTKACNIGASVATGRVLLFMNNDIEVNSQSIARGVARLLSDDKVGSVGGRIILMNGQLQEAGSEIFNDGGTCAVGRLEDPTEIRHSLERQVRYVSGCFLFVRRSDFEDIGGFDEQFSPGYYEETDLCFRLEQAGRVNIYDPSIYVYHYEYATYSRGRPPNISSAIMLQNREKFRSKQAEILTDLPVPGSDPSPKLAAARRDSDRLSIAIVEDLIPDPQLGSGFVRSRDLVEALLNNGHRVTIFIRHFAASADYARLRARGVDLVPCYIAENGENPLQGREFDFDILWVCRTHNFAAWAGHHRAAQRRNDNLRLIFDTEALRTLRDLEYRRTYGLPMPRDTDQAFRMELSVDQHPSCIVTVNELDRSWAKRFTNCPVIVIGHALQARTGLPSVSNRDGIYFCGSFHAEESPNYDSLQWFLGEVWPNIHAELPDVTFRFSGHADPSVDIAALIGKAPQVSYLGKVPDVRDELDRSRIFVAPTRYAGGIPHKVHQAMASGVPTFCTDLLAKQLCLSGMEPTELPLKYASPEHPDEWASACIDLLTDDRAWNTLHTASRSFIEEHVSTAQFEAAIKETLQQAMSR